MLDGHPKHYGIWEDVACTFQEYNMFFTYIPNYYTNSSILSPQKSS